MVGVGYLAICWRRGCQSSVPRDADHIGLCDSHRDELRDPNRKAPG